MSIILIVFSGNQIHKLLANNQSQVLSGINSYGEDISAPKNFPSAFWLMQYGINFIFSMKIINNLNMQKVTTNLVLLYQIGYFFLIIVVPVWGVSFLLTVLVWLLTLQKTLVTAPPVTEKSDEQLLNDLKINMNQVQDYLIQLHNEVKALKKFTGLITPKSKPTVTQVRDEEVENHNVDLDIIQEKLGSYQGRQATEMLKTVDRDEFERTNSGIERPISLVKPTEYIMPKREKSSSNAFPTQQFLSTKMLTDFDQKKVEEEVTPHDSEPNGPELTTDESFKAFPLEFNDPTVIENKEFREKVGFNLNDYDYTTGNKINETEFQIVYQVGDRIMDNDIEYEILLVVPRQIKDIVMYELTLKSTVDETIKSVMKK
ncbi:hypothetical protein [Spiroplasma endosymbiont of Stenodema calcarata]|uniref:hypothetical protein n=1 Tax=Spiroplasma endosymbiont of Stenodema calcarata TaxID=3139328 RepID=UPI003CCADE68